jgi:hypothetical protein
MMQPFKEANVLVCTDQAGGGSACLQGVTKVIVGVAEVFSGTYLLVIDGPRYQN